MNFFVNRGATWTLGSLRSLKIKTTKSKDVDSDILQSSAAWRERMSSKFRGVVHSFLHDTARTVAFGRVIDDLIGEVFDGSTVTVYSQPLSAQSMSASDLSIKPELYYADRKVFETSDLRKSMADISMIIASGGLILVNLSVPSSFKKLLSSKVTQKIWFTTWDGNRRALQNLRDPMSIMLKYFEMIGLDKSSLPLLLLLPTHASLAFLDLLKRLIHQAIDIIPSESRYFIDLAALAGYPKMVDREMTDDPYLWLTENVPTAYDSKWWSSQFRSTFIESIIHAPGMFLSLDQFTIQRWRWVTDGAAKESKAEIGDTKYRTKLGAALSLSDEELLAAVRHAVAKGGELGVFLKGDERGFKRRLIVNVNLGAYILAAYVRYVLEAYVGKDPKFAKLSTTFTDVENVIDLLKHGQLAMPLDESAYDYHMTEQCWSGFFEFLEELFPKSGFSLFETMCRRSYWTFENASGPWRKGMPSGLALTSFLNSWVNYIKQTTIINSDLHWAAGDDVLSFPKNFISLDAVAQEYAKFGAEINIKKNWISNRYAEYLKELYAVEGVSGYPARIYGSLIWAGPEHVFLPSAKLNEIAELWKQLYDRLGLPMDVQLVSADLSRAVSRKVANFSAQVAKLWLSVPKVLGGFGRGFNLTRFVWKNTVLERQEYKKLLWTIPPRLVYDSHSELTLLDFKISRSQARYGPAAHLPPIETLEQWIARLNNEEQNGYKGIYSDLQYSVIPLPTVDFVSTKRMSEFAAHSLANVMPNLGGSWTATTSRLIHCAADVAFAVKRYLSLERLTVLV